MPGHPWSIVIHGGAVNACHHAQQQLNMKKALNHIVQDAASALEQGTKARHVALLAVSALEDSPYFNAGKGSALTRDGNHELDAGIVDGHTGAYGAVIGIKVTKNSVLAAGVVLEKGPHCMLAGDAADALAHQNGLVMVNNDYFTTDYRRSHWNAKTAEQKADGVDILGTVGAIVLDSGGQLAAAGSTGGTTGKSRGRVGDTAVLGAGLYADAHSAVICSGVGDGIFRSLITSKAANYHTAGLSIAQATRKAVAELSSSGLS